MAIDESERIRLVEKYHRAARIKLPNSLLHASIHVVVENQLAMEDQAMVRETLARLMAEGLPRHDAVHAIGSVLASHIHEIATSKDGATFSESDYHAELKELTAKKWLQGEAMS